jgi:uncharacterized membrane protein
MPIRLKYQGPNGETRRWTIKEIIQGRPIDRPTHVMLVHFPIAFYIGALVFDIVSHLGSFPSAPLMATWLILGAFIGTLGAALTGLVDRSTMRPGSRTRATATRHMLVQFGAGAVFVVDFILRWSDRHGARASWGWIALDVIGVLAVSVGADIGGQMVYKMGFRVSGAGE